MAKRLLVTGGSGFIGSNFIRRFLKTHPDWCIVNLDKLTYSGNPENTRDYSSNERYQFVQGDIGDAPCVHKVMSGCDGIVHFAAETHVDRSIEDANDFLVTNILGTRVMVETAKRLGIKRFIHISTDEVYGSLTTGSAKEDFPMEPNSPYSASKAAGDLLIRSYWKTYQYPAIIVRSTNNFGPYQFPEKVIPLFVTNLLQNKKVPLYGNGENQRDWLFVEDNCAALELVFDAGEEGTVYNVGAGNEITNLTLAHAILRIMGFGKEMIQYVADRPGHDLRYSVDVSRLRLLGFKPRWTFETALQRTIDWYKQNSSWWQPLKRDKFTVK
jgi:dTDP-glucose 4,6-dehydratase